jgi:hypothetical protein
MRQPARDQRLNWPLTRRQQPTETTVGDRPPVANCLAGAPATGAWRSLRTPLIVAGVLQVLILVGALWLGISLSEPETEARFRPAPVRPGREAAELQAAVLAAMERAAPPPAPPDRLLSQSPFASALQVALPPVDLALPAGSDSAVFGQWLAGGAVLADADAALGHASQLEFFGMTTSATRIVIACDISATVKHRAERSGLSMEIIREETRRALNGLNANTLFGLIQFARRHQALDELLQPATVDALAKAGHWLDRSFRTDGSAGRGWQGGRPDGIESVLQAAFNLDPQPDLLIIISDGDFYRTLPGGGSQKVPWADIRRLTDQLQGPLANPCRIDFVGFQPRPADRPQIERWIQSTGGNVRWFE